MLTIGKLGIGQESYYLEKVAEGAEDYYSGPLLCSTPARPRSRTARASE